MPERRRRRPALEPLVPGTPGPDPFGALRREIGGPAGAAAAEALALLKQGKTDRARARLDRAVERWPSRALLLTRSQVLSKLGYMAEAAADLGALLREGPDAELYRLRSDLHAQRRRYDDALADLGRALRLEPRRAGLHERRGEVHTLAGRLDRAQADFDRAAALAPGEDRLKVQALRNLLLRGQKAKAARAIDKLEARPATRAEARFYRAYLRLQSGRPAEAERGFARLLAALPQGDPRSARAAFYRMAARAARIPLSRRLQVKKKTSAGKLSILGLGLFPPDTATLEVLQAVGRCDVVFNNVAGPKVRELLSGFCARVRPATYDAARDEGRWTEEIVSELARGRRVGFVTRGHPLVFGGLAHSLVKRCRKEGLAFETFGAVSSIDVLLARMGLALGNDFAGIQAYDRPAVERARSLNTELPLLVYFYATLKASEAAGFRRALERHYPASQPVWLFGPQYDSPPAELRLSELTERFPCLDASLILFVPGKKVPGGPKKKKT